ncbi:uncharacterized protein G2W53_015900 [Senna tora]|uniref:Uncharacterized protein n=1 Tax=Senna tora TaxID=362788 RepID=A0A835CAV4_9FABA|nr:uncharacterized protein G2W53_015900 [Senna tora]
MLLLRLVKVVTLQLLTRLLNQPLYVLYWIWRSRAVGDVSLFWLSKAWKNGALESHSVGDWVI